MANKAGIYEALWRPHRLKKEYNIAAGDHLQEWDFEQNNRGEWRRFEDYTAANTRPEDLHLGWNQSARNAR